MLSRTKAITGLIVTSLLLIFVPIVYAQEDVPLNLRLSRNFGYSSGTGRIQGTFTSNVRGPDDLARVVFFIDGEVMGEADEPPFELRFHTGDYPLGVHTLTALGYTVDGRELRSNEQKREFVPADEGWRFAGSIILLVFGVIVIGTVISFVVPLIVGRGKKKPVPSGAPASYGVFGGTICPKCGRPFGMHIWGLNMVVGKFDLCPHCGKWSMVRRASQESLRQAEAAELETVKQAEGETSTAEDRLRKELEDSRYQDL